MNYRVALLLALAACCAGAVTADETFRVTVDVSGAPLGELAARLQKCTGNFTAFGNELKADCVHHLVSTGATCFVSGSSFQCNVGGVVLDTAHISFACDAGVCPFADGDLSMPSDADEDCPFAPHDGFLGSCYTSAFCLAKKLPADDFISFGDFCPSPEGDFCCAHNAAKDNSFSGGSAGDYSARQIDYIADMDFQITYTLSPPAKIKIRVDVPYITSVSRYNYTQDGVEREYKICPSSYLVDFTDPVETEPLDFSSSTERASWTPLTHYPKLDQIGEYRSSCSNTNMTYSSENDFIANFGYPDTTADGAVNLAYGATPIADALTWDASVSQDGIPNPSQKFWTLGTAPAPSRNAKIAYETGSFDLVKTYAKCKRYNDGAKLVSSGVESDKTFIGGVPYDVETYSWVMNVCQVGFFGTNCADKSKTQMYAKTCRKTPASFSIGPQQMSHVMVTPVAAELVSKTFLESVTSHSMNCDIAHERVALTMNLVFTSNSGYSLATDSTHDVLEPTGVLGDTPGAHNDISLGDATAYSSTAAFIESSSASSPGIYKLEQRIVTGGGDPVYYQKIVLLTKCYNTEFDASKLTRGAPAAFLDEIKTDGNDAVQIDIELRAIKEQTSNILNLRILATKETFVLSSADKLTQQTVSAKQEIYGSYATAMTDQDKEFPAALPTGEIMFGGDQICSKHQVVDGDAQVANLIPNSFAPCMLSPAAALLTIPGEVTLLAGSTVWYKAFGMNLPQQYVFGCFADWLDLDAANREDTYEGETLYTFATTKSSNILVGTHDSINWLVRESNLNLDNYGPDRLSDKFGAGLFYYNSTSSQQVVAKSEDMQIDQATRESQQSDPSHMTAGCAKSPGNLKSACNLVCFDLVEGLLTDQLASAGRVILLHHISVAVIATSEQSTSNNKFPALAHRRALLQTVSPLVRASTSSAPAARFLTVKTGTVAAIAPAPNASETGAAHADNADKTEEFAHTYLKEDNTPNYVTSFLTPFFALGLFGFPLIGVACMMRAKDKFQKYRGADGYRP